MDSKNALVVFQGKKIRRKWFNDEWWFSVVDIIDVLMYCVSIYPAQLYDCKINTISEMQKYKASIGYSSHEIVGYAIKYAVLQGVSYVERHYTLSKKMKGHEHAISSDKKEMIGIIKSIEEAEQIRGLKHTLTEAEQKIKDKYKWCKHYA